MIAASSGRVRASIAYAAYLARHKAHVYREGRKLGVGRLQLIVHDLSKFTPSEWGPMVENYAGRYNRRSRPSWLRGGYSRAFRTHCRRNPHHHEYWSRRGDGGRPAEMPERYVREMVADWRGASMAKGYGPDVRAYYRRTATGRCLHPATRRLAESLIGIGDPS